MKVAGVNLRPLTSGFSQGVIPRRFKRTQGCRNGTTNILVGKNSDLYVVYHHLTLISMGRGGSWSPPWEMVVRHF